MKCTVVGEYDRKERHMSYPRIDMPLRTDQSFRNQLDEAHHKERSPLELLPIDMVSDFIVADSLHLLDLGIMKRCLIGWTIGNLKKKNKWSSFDIENINQALMNANSRMPNEIHRAVRSLNCISFWKATEFRTFLLYIGPVVLKENLETNIYKHFLQLFCAVTICSTDIFISLLNVAESLFKDYVENYIQIYGEDTISSNVHNLVHVVDDVRRFGNLTKISAYPFENALYSIKLLLRSGNRPLAQVTKRLHEMAQIDSTSVVTRYPYPARANKLELNKYSCLYVQEGTILINNLKNKWFMTKSHDIVEMVYVTYKNEDLYIYGSSVNHKIDFFEEPFKSSFLNIFCAVDAPLKTPKLYSVSEFKCKLVALKYLNITVFLPLLHTYT